MKNKKGFVLTETLVVVVFLVTICTFIYVSVVPLMGKYEDLIDRERDIDIVYKLYNIRKLLYDDDNKDTIVQNDIKEITCTDFAKSDYCTKLMEQMELTNYKLIYVKEIYSNLNAIRQIDANLNTTELYRYIRAYQNDEGEDLILLDRDRHTIAHLMYAPFIQTY